MKTKPTHNIYKQPQKTRNLFCTDHDPTQVVNQKRNAIDIQASIYTDCMLHAFQTIEAWLQTQEIHLGFISTELTYKKNGM